MMPSAQKKEAVVELAAKDLNGNGGIFCPSPVAGMKLWNTHPRVFLDAERVFLGGMLRDLGLISS